MAAAIKVALVGATGRTGQSIVNALLASDTKFDVTALTRPAAINSAANQALRDRGVRVVLADLLGPHEDLVNVLKGIDVVICTIVYDHLNDQIPLIRAAKEAGVGRFVPNFWGTPAPRGTMKLYDHKLDILAEAQKLYLPFTVIDVGWWTQQLLFQLPSGRTNHGAFDIFQFIPGEGNIPLALTDCRDIGRYTARIIADPRTLNKFVLAYTEVMTVQETVEVQQRLSGEKIDLPYRSIDDIRSTIESATSTLKEKPDDAQSVMQLIWHQYLISWGVRGDNTPESAKYLGYLDFKELYPDVKGKTLETMVQETLDGKDTGVEDPMRKLAKIGFTASGDKA